MIRTLFCLTCLIGVGAGCQHTKPPMQPTKTEEFMLPPSRYGELDTSPLDPVPHKPKPKPLGGQGGPGGMGGGPAARGGGGLSGGGAGF